MLDFLTPAALRAWEQARLLARESQSREVEPLHMLWALVLDESRASQTLQELGITAESLQKSNPVEPPLPEDLAWEQSQDEEDLAPQSDGLPDAGETTRQVLREARHQAGPFSGAIETGTEHLLQGLALVDSPVSQLLARRGFVPVLEIPRRGGGTPGAAESTPPEPANEPLVSDEPLVLARIRVTDETDGHRIVDAAANRAREGLRMLEDFLRFARDNRFLTAELKSWRHDFARLLNRYGERALLASRDTEEDVGTTVRTRHETTRDTLIDVVRAAFKRTEEATRTLEEISKALRPDIAEPLSQLRYRLYTLEKAVLTAEAAGERLAGKPLYMLLTEDLCHHGSGPAVKEALAGGVGIVQIREKGWEDRRLLDHARRVREWTTASGGLLVLNDRPDLAVLADADGVHVGQDDLSVREVRRIVGPDRIVGVSTHSLEQARRAVLDGADYIGVGPVFPTTTKSFAAHVGLDLVQQVAAEISLPWYAIGGINAERVGSVAQSGARGVAVSSAICSAEDPREAARHLRAFF
jgi:thiamine-phosphate pyrophosphorylase